MHEGTIVEYPHLHSHQQSESRMHRHGQEPVTTVYLDYSVTEMRARLHEMKMNPAHDLHREHAAQLFGVPYADVTPEQRTFAKADSYRTAYTATGRTKP